MADGRPVNEFFSFVKNGQNEYYYTIVTNGKTYVLKQKNPIPLQNNPANLRDMQVTFGTNDQYFSGVRSVSNVWNMVNDGADIVREVKYKGKGYADELYLMLIRWDYNLGYYRLYYTGRFDLKEAKDNPLSGYNCPCVDTSIWGVLSQTDNIKYQIDCTPQNPLAIPILFDGINLKSRFIWQTINSEFVLDTSFPPKSKYLPIVLVNSEGDSNGLVTKNQEDLTLTEDNDKSNYFFKTTRPIRINLDGEFTFQFKEAHPGFITVDLILVSDAGVVYTALGSLSFNSQVNYGTTYSIKFNTVYDLARFTDSETLILKILPRHIDTVEDWHFLPTVTNITISALTQADASIVYGLRPLDLLQAIVARATDNQFEVNSNFFTLNNKKVVTCGNALRNAPNAYIVSSFEDWFKSFDIEEWLAFRLINNQLWVEPAPTIYDDSTNLFTLGEISAIEVFDAKEYLFADMEIGSPKQDYRHSSGRLEFNSTNTFSVKQFNVKSKLSLISPYRKDCYGMEFIRLDYQQQSTKDNSGDNDAFIVKITDTKSSEGVLVENFVSVQVDTLPLAPIIYFPFENDTITNNKPTIRGVCTPNTVVNVYADGNPDGNFTSDSFGNFAYDVVTALSPFVTGVADGVHTIELTYTDLTGTISAVTVTIVSGTTNPIITYPANNDSLYDNKPLIRGFLQTGAIAQITMDGASISVTGDGNCRFSLKINIPIPNGVHVISISGISNTFNVNSFVEIPLITSFKEGFTINQNLPLVEGVATPGLKVDLWLDYYDQVSVGTTFSDSNGNWFIQLVPLFKPDGVTVLTPMSNGLHILSTSLAIQSASVDVNGFTLDRPAYDSIEGVIDNTVFNTMLTPKHNLLTRMKFFKSVFYQQPDTIIKFETGDKNQAFSTTLGGVSIKENDDVYISTYKDKPLFLPYILKGKIETPFFFVDIVNNFSSGGLVQMSYQGSPLYCLPIGTMTVQDVTKDVQEWSLLVSVKTPLTTLLKLSTPGSNFEVMKGGIFRSDYNTLHFVKYNYTGQQKYNYEVEVPEDLFGHRNARWSTNPEYIQKWQKNDVIRDQIVINSVSGSILLNLYDCKTGLIVGTFNYSSVTPAPIPFPDVVMETMIDLHLLGDGKYYFVMVVNGIEVAISENILLADVWEKTILIESSHSYNKTGAFFSTGFKSVMRIEGLMEKWRSGMEILDTEDDAGSFDLLSSVITKKRTMLVGDGRGLPDYVYLKVASAITLDDLSIQGFKYVIAKDGALEPAERFVGHPMYYFSVELRAKENQSGYVYDAAQGGTLSGVTLVVDAGAFGMGGGGLIMIEVDSEQVPATNPQFNLDLGVAIPSAGYTTQVSFALVDTLNIDWGDSHTDTITDITATVKSHNYVAAGNYTIKVSGRMPSSASFFAGNGNLDAVLTSIGNLNSSLLIMDSMFKGCTHLTTIPNGFLNTCALTTSMQQMFSGCTGLTSGLQNNLFDSCAKLQYTANFFNGCTGLTGSIPTLIFDKTTEMLAVGNFFTGCVGLTGAIPAGLFSKLPLLNGVASYFNGCIGLTGAIPAGLFSSNLLITSFQTTFNGCRGLTGNIPSTLFSANVAALTFNSTFFGCTGLTGAIPSGLFANNLQVTSYLGCFSGCTGLTGAIPTNLFPSTVMISAQTTFQNCSGLTGSIPVGIFKNKPSLNSLANCFNGCSNLTGAIPLDLVLNSPAITLLNGLFNGCNKLTSIPSGLFDTNIALTNCNAIFNNCTGIVSSIPSTLFGNSPNITNFGNTFKGCTGLTGAAPTLWISYPSAPTTSGCFNGDSQLTNFAAIPAAWK